ncbi:hypothetical protein [Bradyrhizobium sp. LA2.1]|uniref:hypothetical protein n=1 Tax=Bradyrhizobium sp. LA2.1 TaxID=3156376 RepID=UPI00339788FD
MTIPVLKIKVLPKSTVKGKMDVRFPANIDVENFITIVRANGKYTFGIDYTKLDPAAFSDPAETFIAVLDAVSGTYKVTTLSIAVNSVTQVEQHITAAGPVAVVTNAGIVRVDQTSGAAITLNLPAAASKSCPVLIADWKGDAGTNNITIVPAGAEKIQGQSSWTIAGDTGSVFLRPIAGVGYVI